MMRIKKKLGRGGRQKGEGGFRRKRERKKSGGRGRKSRVFPRKKKTN